MRNCWKCGQLITPECPDDGLEYTSEPPCYAHLKCPPMKCDNCGYALLPAVEMTVRMGGPRVCGPCIDRQNSPPTINGFPVIMTNIGIPCSGMTYVLEPIEDTIRRGEGFARE